MTDYNILAAELVEHLRECADAKHNREAEDYTHGEFRILTLLSTHTDGISPGDICEMLGMTTPRISAAVAGLVKKGLVDRVTDEFDRRRIHVYITDKGTELVNRKRDELTSLFSELLEYLGEEDAHQYVRIMGRIGKRTLADTKEEIRRAL